MKNSTAPAVVQQRLVRLGPSIYTASKTSQAWRWRGLRDKGFNIIATWIDEAEEGQSADYADLAQRCIEEAAAADITILYCQPGDILKGALLEVGAALAAGKEVRCVGDCESISRVFRKHPRWIECDSLAASLPNVKDEGRRTLDLANTNSNL